MNKYIDYVAETDKEEYAILVGRLEAFAAYVNSQKYSIDREICSKILGFELEEEREPEEKKEASFSDALIETIENNVCPF